MYIYIDFLPLPWKWKWLLQLNIFDQVVSQQLSRLQDAADRCKTLTKATEAQLKFFQVKIMKYLFNISNIFLL